MKKIHIFPALLLLPALASAQGEYTIKGKVGKVDAPAKMYLRYQKDGKWALDSTVMSKGSFEFKGTTDDAVKATLALNYGPNVPREAVQGETVTLYLEKGNISVQSKDSLKFAKVKGGAVNADFLAYKAATKENDDKNKALDAEYYAQPAELRKDPTFLKPLQEKSMKYYEERKAIAKKFAEAYPNTVVGLEALKEYAGSSPDYAEIQPLFAKLSAGVRSSKAGAAYADRLEKVKAVAVGQVAPAFSQNDPDGNPVSLASFRGKYVLIDFWASWCGPCRAENPHVVKAYNEFKDKNFTILGVSLDQPNAKDKWLKAIQDDNLTWTQVSDLNFWKNEVAQLYAVNSIPQNFLLDPNGVIIARNLRGEALTKKLAEVIK